MTGSTWPVNKNNRHANLEKINLLLTSFALHRTIHIQFVVVVTQIVHLCTQIVENSTTLVVTLVVSL